MDRVEFFRDVMTTAIEGGIDYWAEVSTMPKELQATREYVSFLVTDAEDQDDPWHLVDDVRMAASIERIITDPVFRVRKDIKTAIAEAWYTNDASLIDCECADVIVQVAAYGEIVFG